LILEIVIWSDKYVRTYNQDMNPYDKGGSHKISTVRKKYKKFASQFEV